MDWTNNIDGPAALLLRKLRENGIWEDRSYQFIRYMPYRRLFTRYLQNNQHYVNGGKYA